jgi:hypothetical protein
MFIVKTYVQLAGTEPRQFGASQDARSFREACKLAKGTVAQIHEVLLTEGYDVYCEIAG